MRNIDDVHMAYYGATVHAIQTLGVYVNCDGKRFVNEGLTSSLVNQEIMQQFYARAYLFFDEAARQTMVETAYCNAAVVGGDRVEWLREHGATVVQADSLEELANRSDRNRFRRQVQRQRLPARQRVERRHRQRCDRRS